MALGVSYNALQSIVLPEVPHYIDPQYLAVEASPTPEVDPSHSDSYSGAYL